MDIGFIGLGAMGAAMARNLVGAGHAVTVWNRSPGPAEALGEAGARVATSAAEAAARPVLVSMLADDRALRAVLEQGGVLEAMPAGAVHVNHGTISEAYARELADAHGQRGLGYVAAPVFGRPDAAAAAKLHVVVAGDPSHLAMVEPLLRAVSQRVWPMGSEPAQANVVKIAGNFMIAAAIESMAEASTLVRAFGVEAPAFLEMMSSTLFASPVYQGYGRLIAEQRFEPAGFRMRLGYKDVGLALSAGEAQRVPLPLAGLLREAMLEALAGGGEDLDWSALARVAAERARLDRR